MKVSRGTVAILFVLVGVLALPTSAAVHVEQGGEVDREQRSEYFFSGDDEPHKFKFSVSFKAQRQAHLRIYFYGPSPRGGWSEMDDMRVIIQNNTDLKSTTFELPKGRYRMIVSVRRGDYTLKLEDAPEDE